MYFSAASLCQCNRRKHPWSNVARSTSGWSPCRKCEPQKTQTGTRSSREREREKEREGWCFFTWCSQKTSLNLSPSCLKTAIYQRSRDRQSDSKIKRVFQMYSSFPACLILGPLTQRKGRDGSCSSCCLCRQTLRNRYLCPQLHVWCALNKPECKQRSKR